MPVYAVTPRTGLVKSAAEVSPRIIVATDAAVAEAIPEPVRFAADIASTEDLGVFRNELPATADGFIVWLEREELLQGGTEDLRGVFLSGRRAKLFVPVHLSCLTEADYVSLQPRLISPGAAAETVSEVCRIKSHFTPSALARNFWASCTEPWARLHAALLCERVPANGIELLKHLWQTLQPSSFLKSLVLRNLALALMRARQIQKSAELLSLGIQAYPGYSDLYFLSAVLWLYRQKPAKAVPDLERAMKFAEPAYVGSGGEESYRSSWLLGAIFEQMGEEKRAGSCFMPGVLRRPAFPPAVSAMLRQRFSRFRAEQLSFPLCELIRREPVYLDPVFDFFLRHRVYHAPRRLLRTLPLPIELRESLEARLAAADGAARARSAEPAGPHGVVIEGPFLIVSGHARINRMLGCSLLDSKSLDASFEPSEPGSAKVRLLPERSRILEALRRCPSRTDLTIRHCWPPNFRRPEAGGLVCMLPWEHRAVPRVWVREIERSVDELWVPSQFVAAAFGDAGLSRERIRVIPHGFTPQVFHPEVRPWRPVGCRSCMFLFVGGTIRRKGVDLLLRAYSDAFSPDDDVTLVIKDTGSSGFYQHNNLLREIRAARRRSNAPHILLLTEEFSDARLASLYRGCDAFVLPYRGEGFGMPLLEAMACGKPVVTVSVGPAPEFCAPQSSYLIPAKEVPVTDAPPPFGEFSSAWTWFEPDLVELASALRSVYDNRQEAERRGKSAAELVLQTHAWPRILGLYLERVSEINRKKLGAVLIS